MRKILIAPLSASLRWVFAAPPRRSKSKLRKLFHCIILFLVFILLFWAFIRGPGVVLLPFTPMGFSSLSDGANSVFYTDQDETTARKTLQLASEAQAAILDFWGWHDGTEFARGVQIYACSTTKDYWRLTLNRAGGCAMMGRIVLNMEKMGKRFSLGAFLKHEMSHIYFCRRFGWLNKVLSVPNWFDEGCATIVQGSSLGPWNLEELLCRDPKLISVTSLTTQLDWESVVAIEGGAYAPRQYAYVRDFTSYLIDNYGKGLLRAYLGLLSLGNNADKVFKRVFHRSLAQVEVDWLAENKKIRRIPQETAFVELSTHHRVLIKWGTIGFVLIFGSLWAIRQLFRALRFFLRSLLPAQ